MCVYHKQLNLVRNFFKRLHTYLTPVSPSGGMNTLHIENWLMNLNIFKSKYLGFNKNFLPLFFCYENYLGRLFELDSVWSRPGLDVVFTYVFSDLQIDLNPLI